MKNSLLLISSLFCSALAIGCAKDSETDTKTSTNPTATNDPTGNESGSETGASATDASATVASATATEADPTMASSATDPLPGTSGDGGTTAACTFLNCDDMGGGGSCDNFAQDCPEGQKCAAWADDGSNSWNSTTCVDVAPDGGAVGDDCTSTGNLTGIDSCAFGAMCWNTNAEGVGTCVALCTGSAEAPLCPNNTPCTIANMGSLNLCLSTCDPLLQNCDGEDLCIPNGDNFVCVLDAGGEEGQANDPCEFANVCDPGLVCLDPATGGMGCDAAAGGCCSPFCEFPDGACPNADQSCVQWFDPAMLPANDPLLDIGVCGVPV